MTFEPGQKTLHTSVAIIQDDQPEEIETFYVTLSDPTGGAEIGPHNMITVNILSNDNANGIIEFPQVCKFLNETHMLRKCTCFWKPYLF